MASDSEDGSVSVAVAVGGQSTSSSSGSQWGSVVATVRDCRDIAQLAEIERALKQAQWAAELAHHIRRLVSDSITAGSEASTRTEGKAAAPERVSACFILHFVMPFHVCACFCLVFS